MAKRETSILDRCCLECHFLKKWSKSDVGREVAQIATQSDREGLELGLAAKILLGEYGLACHQGVWQTQPGRESCGDIIKTLVADRAESCFFYPYSAGMLLSTALELERRETVRREAGRNRDLVKWSIIVAIIAALLGVALGSMMTDLLSL